MAYLPFPTQFPWFFPLAFKVGVTCYLICRTLDVWINDSHNKETAVVIYFVMDVTQYMKISVSFCFFFSSFPRKNAVSRIQSTLAVILFAYHFRYWYMILVIRRHIYMTFSSPRQNFFLHALSFECISKLCVTSLN